ncbi:hypothetical protein IQ247_20245 [Plectonema cf. radiosum LEGE 06105]|uniref:Uncharacterized protein n=1 Tax=Plectonema cf. radiosum LEGE 06105 TaxID=945769 RepID=A0A8J7F2I2_9CYAN|nr:hypothetical protein [Plectonema radiosum]MBE9214971.1 hypothetical protein [Plectonema cf. radiosum LEGE 06105]
MTDILTNYDLSGMVTSLMAGDLNLLTGFIWFIVATIVSMIGGAIGGMLLAGEELGYNFAAILGGLFGPAGVIPGAILGLIVLNLLSNY